VEKIHELAPKLSKQDAHDLVAIASQPRGAQKLEKILRQYKIAKVLNKTTANKIVKLLSPIGTIIDVIGKVFG
jgi:hypothetical protein